MRGPIALVRSKRIAAYENLGPIYGWREKKAYLFIDEVKFKGKAGAILCYYNPPVHQVGNPGLDAFLQGLDRVLEKKDGLHYLILYGANDPVHAGGDLKESLKKLDKTLEAKREKELAGASEGEIDRLFEWADTRLRKGIGVHGRVREAARSLRVVALCGGGIRFGGSAEIPMMADYLVGDSRSAICFSEAMIGLIPGWSGIARTLIKAGLRNAEYMSKTSKEVKADELERIGIYNVVVDIPFPFPKRQKTGDPERDKRVYQRALEAHNDETGLLVLPEGLEIATRPKAHIPVLPETQRLTLATKKDIAREVERRKNPENYSRLWGKPLKDVKGEIAEMGRPLAPQSIGALNRLLEDYDLSAFDEARFVEKEMEADARLYRDQRFREGLKSTLEQRVADYREAL